MRRWGWVVTGFYALVLAGLVLPAVAWLLAFDERWSTVLAESYKFWFTWFWLGVLLAGEAILLLVTVDTSFRRPDARRNIWLSIGVVGSAVGLLAFLAVLSALIVARGKDSDNALLSSWLVWAMIPAFWTFWAALFYRHSREHADPLTRAISWLFKGSVLELLVVVPCHVWVRRRGDCSAPAVTGYGIATGIAVMLLSFGPGVLFLYRRRLERYQTAER